MTLVVPFDGSELSRAALVRATQFEQILDEGIVAVTVIPNDHAEYAAERGWITRGESFDPQTIVANLEEQVERISPRAAFEYVVVDRHAQSGRIATAIREFAKRHNAGIVFLGSENAGRYVRSVSSVGGTIAADQAYDTMIVTNTSPTPIEKLERTLPTEEVLE